MNKLYSQALQELYQIDTCHETILKDYEEIQKYILIIQLSILCTFLALLSWQISSFIQGTNLVWKKISQNAYSSFFNLKTKCCERLTIHLQAQEEDVQAFYDITRLNNNEFSITYSQIGGYCWRFSILFILTALYLAVFYAILLDDLNFLSDQKNEIISSVYLRKFHLERIENFLLLRKANPEFTQVIIEKCIDQYYIEQKKALFNNFGGIIKGKNYEYIYDYKDGEGFLRYGMNNAANLMVLDSYELIEGAKNQTWVEFYGKGVLTYALFDLVLDKVVITGNGRIDELYLSTVVGVTFYLAFCFLLCFLFYFPYLRKKGNTILSFQCIFHLFISIETSKITSSNTIINN